MSRSQFIHAAAVVLLVAAGCSSGSTTEKGSSRPSTKPSPCVAKQVPITFPQCPINEIGAAKDLTAQGDNVTVDLISGDAVFDPTFIKVQPGAKVTVRMKTGIILHDFHITALNVHHTGQLEKTTTFSFTLPEAGPVLFYCGLHLAGGMQGAFYFA